MSKGYLPRKAAWEILLKVSAGAFSDHALEKVIANYQFKPIDVAFITELSFGCIKYRKLLDLWIDHLSRFSYDKQPPKLRWLLHVGLYQILKMDKIPHPASISTTVEIAKQTELNGLSGVVNAILRNAIKQLEINNFPSFPSNNADRMAYFESIPNWLVKDIFHWYGDIKGEKIVRGFNKKPSIDLRINILKTNLNKCLKDFNFRDIKVEPIENMNNAITFKSKVGSIKALPGYKDGKWVVQNRSSQWVAPLLNPKKGEKILDTCAAPGIKTTHLAELINDHGEIWAIDRSDKRLRILDENLKRLNLKSIRTLNADATSLADHKPEFVNYFDKILIDAPCSGIGTFSRNPDARWSINKKKIDELISLQEKLLLANLPLLKKTGTLVYSTCTICPLENNLLIKKFIENNKKLFLIEEKQILPNVENEGDGFYAAIIRFK